MEKCIHCGGELEEKKNNIIKIKVSKMRSLRKKCKEKGLLFDTKDGRFK